MKDTHLSVVILTIVISYTLAKSHTPFSGASLLSESERDSYKATDRHNHGKKGKSTRKNRHGNSDSGSLPTVSFQLDDILGRLQNLGVNTTDFISGSAGGFLLDLLERLESGEDLARAAGHDQVDVAILQADTVRSITAKDEKVRQQKMEISLSFNLSSMTEREILSKAELRLCESRYVARAITSYNLRFSIEHGEDDLSQMSYRVTSWQNTEDGCFILDITPALKALITPGYSTAMVTIRVKPRTDRRRSQRSIPKFDKDAANKPMLVLYTRDQTFFEDFFTESIKKTTDLDRIHGAANKRQRRSAKLSAKLGFAGSFDKKLDKECRLQDFTVDFDTIGWGEWILHPKYYNANKCSGKCVSPVSPRLNPTNHAILQSLMRYNVKDSVARPCCVPTKLHPISMLYLEKDEIVVRHHEGMVAHQCGCR